ncbi:MAG: biopolymer transporter ExbD [Myxococcota bacterium]
MGSFRDQPPRRSSGALAEINVTPLVDVLLVLLIIFMVTAPLVHHGVNVPTPNADPPDTRQPPPTSQEKPTLFVDRKRQCSYKGKKFVDLKKLEAVLRSDFAKAKKKELFLQADPDLFYGQVMEIISLTRRAGIKNIGTIVEPRDLQ